MKVLDIFKIFLKSWGDIEYEVLWNFIKNVTDPLRTLDMTDFGPFGYNNYWGHQISENLKVLDIFKIFSFLRHF